MKTRLLKDLAVQRFSLLFRLALEATRKGDYALARRYVEIGLRILRKAQLRPPKKYKRRYCRKCLAPLIPGITLSVRIRSEGKGSRVVYRCLLCGWIRRFMIKTRWKKLEKE
ncbi:MAG: ribonuclease P protein component 4 [Desulfurococcaceae archaeon]